MSRKLVVTTLHSCNECGTELVDEQTCCNPNNIIGNLTTYDWLIEAAKPYGLESEVIASYITAIRDGETDSYARFYALNEWDL